MNCAASISARQKGDNDLAAVLKEISRSPSRSPSRPSKIRKMLFTLKKEPVAYTAEVNMQNLEHAICILLTKKCYNANTNVEFRN